MFRSKEGDFNGGKRNESEGRERTLMEGRENKTLSIWFIVRVKRF